MTTSAPIHISVVLDRSGSMDAIADHVVGGFNEYLNMQRQRAGEARVSLIQFDGDDPFELLIDGTDLTEADLTGTNLSYVAWWYTTCPDGTNTNTKVDGCDDHRTP